MASLSPIRVYIGDDWLVQVALVDTAGNAIDLTGATVGVNFWPAFMASPVDLAAAGGGITVVQAKPALVLLTVPRSVTAGIAEQSVLQKTYPTRAQVYVVDTLNRQQTVQLVPFQPIAARGTDLPAAAAVIGAVTAVLSPQGMAGPSGESAYDSAGGDAKWGSLAAWLSSPATPQQALSLYVGDTWAWKVTIADPQGVMPNGLAGFTVTAEFFASATAAPVPLTAANGGIVVLDPVARIVLVTVNAALTGTAQPAPTGVRVAVIVTDPGQNPQTIGVIPVDALSR